MVKAKAKVKGASFGMSIDGFRAGPRLCLDDPLAVGGGVDAAGLSDAHLPAVAKSRRQGDGRRRLLCGARLRQRRRVGPGAQHVRPRPRAVAQ